MELKDIIRQNNIKLKMKNCYIFVSSTFLDMEYERQLLHYKVFPRLEKAALDYGVRVKIIDLRWGITKEQSQELLGTLDVCLKKVNEADPIFLSFIGNRYGTRINVDSKDYINISKFSGINGKSITELEILQGLYNRFYNGEKKNCMFFFRNPAFIGDIKEESIRSIFVDENQEQLAELKRKIISDCTDITNYNASVRIDCDEKYNSGKPYAVLYDMKVEKQPLEDILFTKIMSVVKKIGKYNEYKFDKRELYLEKYLDCADLDKIDKEFDSKMDEVCGEVVNFSMEHGNGKSSTLARYIKRNRDNNLVLFRFFGDEEPYQTINSVCISLAEELSLKLGDNLSFDDFASALFYLQNKISKINAIGVDTILVLDDLNKTVEEEILWMNFLKNTPFKKIIVSKNPEDRYNAFMGRWFKLDHDNDSIRSIINYHLDSYGKKMTKERMDKLIDASNGDFEKLMISLRFIMKLSNNSSIDKQIDTIKPLSKERVIFYSLYIISRLGFASSDTLDTIYLSLAISKYGMSIQLLSQMYLTSITFDGQKHDSYDVAQIKNMFDYYSKFAEYIGREDDYAYITNPEFISFYLKNTGLTEYQIIGIAKMELTFILVNLLIEEKANINYSRTIINLICHLDKNSVNDVIEYIRSKYKDGYDINWALYEKFGRKFILDFILALYAGKSFKVDEDFLKNHLVKRKLVIDLFDSDDDLRNEYEYFYNLDCEDDENISNDFYVFKIDKPSNTSNDINFMREIDFHLYFLLTTNNNIIGLNLLNKEIDNILLTYPSDKPLFMTAYRGHLVVHGKETTGYLKPNLLYDIYAKDKINPNYFYVSEASKYILIRKNGIFSFYDVDMNQPLLEFRDTYEAFDMFPLFENDKPKYLFLSNSDTIVLYEFVFGEGKCHMKLICSDEGKFDLKYRKFDELGKRLLIKKHNSYLLYYMDKGSLKCEVIKEYSTNDYFIDGNRFYKKDEMVMVNDTELFRTKEEIIKIIIKKERTIFITEKHVYLVLNYGFRNYKNVI